MMTTLRRCAAGVLAASALLAGLTLPAWALTANTIPKFGTSNQIVASSLLDNGTSVTTAENVWIGNPPSPSAVLETSVVGPATVFRATRNDGAFLTLDFGSDNANLHCLAGQMFTFDQPVRVTGDLTDRRLLSNGTALVTGDVAISGWGASATKAVVGTDSAGTITVTTNAADTASASPTIVLTFHDGAFAAVPTVVTTWDSSSTGPVQQWLVSPATNAVTFTYNGTPTATSSKTYKIAWMARQ